jgi:Utp11 protein
LRASEDVDRKSVVKKSSREAKELEARLDRLKKIEKMERQTTVQVQLMGKGKRRKVKSNNDDDDDDDDDEKVPVYKWKPQRQK